MQVYQEDHIYRGAWVDQTTVHPAGLTIVILLGIATLFVHRRHATLPLFILACSVAPAQRLVSFGLDFNFVRVLLAFCWLRILVRGEARGFRWRKIDLLVVCWLLAASAAYTVLHGTTEAVIYKLGTSYDALGTYFYFRCVVRGYRDLESLLMGIALLSIPVAALFLVEKTTGRNLFAVLGGVPEITAMREGRLRCQGAFPHPIIAGCFFGSLVPMMASLLWGQAQRKALGVIGLVGCLIPVVVCASSTPLMSVLLGGCVACLWPIRRHLAAIRWSCVAGVVFLHLIMTRPVWYLLARVDLVGGSTGYYRAAFIDAAVRHFPDWALLGVLTTNNWGWGMHDVTSQYILEAVRGGLLGLVFFVWQIAAAFAIVGQLLRVGGQKRYLLMLSWGLGIALFIHCINYIGVSYFGQISVAWYGLLGVIGSLETVAAPRTRRTHPSQGREHAPDGSLAPGWRARVVVEARKRFEL